jgi:hypothetical protein
MPPIVVFEQLVVALLGMFPQVPEGVRAFAKSLTSQFPALYAAGADIAAFTEQKVALMEQMITENRDPTDTENETLKRAVADEHAKIQRA